MNEAGLALASGTAIVPSWTSAPDVPLYAHAVFSKVNQSTPTGTIVTATTIGDDPVVPLPAVMVARGNRLVGVAAAGEAGTYTTLNGFTLGLTQSTTTGGTHALGTAQKAGIGVDETAALEFAPARPPGINRQVAAAIVLRARP